MQCRLAVGDARAVKGLCARPPVRCQPPAGGNTWNQSTLEYAGASQYLATIGEKENEVGYAAVGSYVESIFQQLNGVSFSYDDGETFNTTVNITQLNTFARTGAWPSPNVSLQLHPTHLCR